MSPLERYLGPSFSDSRSEYLTQERWQPYTKSIGIGLAQTTRSDHTPRRDPRSRRNKDTE
jgi:hypothetical protein